MHNLQYVFNDYGQQGSADPEECLTEPNFDLHSSHTLYGHSILEPVSKWTWNKEDELEVDLGGGLFLNKRYGFNNRTFLVTTLAVSTPTTPSSSSSSSLTVLTLHVHVYLFSSQYFNSIKGCQMVHINGLVYHLIFLMNWGKI